MELCIKNIHADNFQNVCTHHHYNGCFVVYKKLFLGICDVFCVVYHEKKKENKFLYIRALFYEVGFV